MLKCASVFTQWESVLSPLQQRVCVWQMVRATHTHNYTHTKHIHTADPPWGSYNRFVCSCSASQRNPQSDPACLRRTFTVCLCVCLCVCVCINFTCHAEKYCTGQLFLSLNLYLHFYWHSASRDGDSLTPPPPTPVHSHPSMGLVPILCLIPGFLSSKAQQSLFKPFFYPCYFIIYIDTMCQTHP